MNLPMLCPGLHNLRVVTLMNNVNLRLLTVYSGQIRSSKSSQFINEANGKEQKKKKVSAPRITLVGHDNNISITTLEEAENISKRRELRLVKLIDFDMKTQRPVYKLMTGSAYLAEELKQRDKRKLGKVSKNVVRGEKVLIMSSNIGEHDLKIQINKVIKWLNKPYEVRVIINGDSSNMENAERIYSSMETHMAATGRILQKRTKGSDIKFQILPLKNCNDQDQCIS